MIKDERIQYPARYHVVWEELFDFATDTALRHSEDLKGKAYAEPLAFLVGAEYPNNRASATEGATYKSLGYVAHRLGMSAEDRRRWYDLARRIPLSQAHVGCIIARLNERDAMVAGLEDMLRSV
jgi:hypothetical protein